MMTSIDRARRAGAWLATVLALIAPGAQAAEWGIEALMRGLAAVRSSEARFEERKEIEILAVPLESSGTLSYTAPDRLEKRTLRPHEERLLLEGDRLTLEMPARGRSRTFSLAEQPVIGAFVESIRATLAGDLAALRRHYRVKLEGGESSWRLVLVPAAAEVRSFVTEIELSGSGHRITAVETHEANGDRTVMTIFPAVRSKE